MINCPENNPKGGRRRDLKQSHNARTNRKTIAIIQQSCSDSRAIANPTDGVFGNNRREVIAISGSLNQRLAGSDPLEVKWTSGKGDEGWSFHPR